MFAAHVGNHDASQKYNLFYNRNKQLVLQYTFFKIKQTNKKKVKSTYVIKTTAFHDPLTPSKQS